MRKRKKANKKADLIIALAYFHRYGWIIAMFICMAFVPTKPFFSVGAFLLLYSLWSFIGYKCRWSIFTAHTRIRIIKK